jgi:hypothetical protein
MQPVTKEHLESLVESKPILLLDELAIGPAFVDAALRPAPSLISSKGGQRFPRELWDMVLGFATRNTSHRLVQPHALKHDGAGRQVLVCKLVSTDGHASCGELKDGVAYEAYEWYLRHPNGTLPDKIPGDEKWTKNEVEDDEGSDEERPEEGSSDEEGPRSVSLKDRPFDIPETADPETTIKIPSSTFESTIKVLFWDITVPDVIARVEGGWCRLCGGGRSHCPGCLRGMRDEVEGFAYVSSTDCSYLMLCPLCVGPEWAEESLERQEQDDRDWDWGAKPYGMDEELEEQCAKFNDWFNARLRALGYLND